MLFRHPGGLAGMAHIPAIENLTIRPLTRICLILPRVFVIEPEIAQIGVICQIRVFEAGRV